MERIVLELVRAGQGLGQCVAVVCLERPGTLAPQVEALGARVACVYKRPGIRLETIGRLRTVLRDLRPDVVHTHQIGALFYGGPAARSVGVPLIVHTEHGKNYAERPRAQMLGRLAGLLATRFFCVSEDIAAEVRSHRIASRPKVHVVPNGIDTARFRQRGDVQALRRSLGIPPEAPVVGTIGRLDEIKRQDLLLRAFARAGVLIPEAHLLLVGDGPLMGELRTLAAGLRLGKRVHFAGYQEQPEHYLQVMDVFALTSRSEGMPLVVLEAWAAGVPVVASRVGGLPELIDEGQTGLLFAPGDECALAAALCGLLTDPGRARRLGEAGQRRVESMFDVRRMASDYQRHYGELLTRKGAWLDEEPRRPLS
ncbi:MAG: glycosyltransferase family 4 protein [Isosphaeraceae bacterium]|nr:glycosyltransferase family 4 protein [Isosphaeraceae bacterium]